MAARFIAVGSLFEQASRDGRKVEGSSGKKVKVFSFQILKNNFVVLSYMSQFASWLSLTTLAEMKVLMSAAAAFS